MEEIRLWRILWEPALQWRWEELQETLQLPYLPLCGIVLLSFIFVYLPYVSLSKCLSLFGPNFNLFQAEATSEGSQEYFDSVVSLLKARKDMNSFNAGVSFGIYYVEAGLKGSRESEFLQNLTRYKSQVCSTDPQVNMFYMLTSTITFV